MKEVNWHMKETFVFPAEIGQPTGAENIKVIPRFTAETVEGRPKLTGIYHIATNVNVTGEKVENYEVGEATVIDDLDLNENHGYFEYALPFNIDFPPEAEDPVDLKTLNPTFEINNHQLDLIWEVACTYQEAGIQQQNRDAKSEPIEKSAEQSKENVTAAKEEKEVAGEAQEEIVQKQAEEDQEEASSKAADVVVATSASAQSDEVLDFIAELEDGISATSFRLNDVFV